MLMFKLGKEIYALPSDIVDSVLEVMDSVPVPNSKKYIKGLINIRGNIIALLDMKALVNLSDLNGNENVIVVKINGELLGLLVGEVEEVYNNDCYNANSQCNENDFKIIQHDEKVITFISEIQLSNLIQEAV